MADATLGPALWNNTGAGDGIRTRDSLLGKHRNSLQSGAKTGESVNWLERFIDSRKGERGLTEKGEVWVRETLGKFLKCLPDPLTATRQEIESYLGQLNGPWSKHSHFRAVRAFYNWLGDQELVQVSPCHRMKAPRLPTPVLGHPSLSQVRELIANAATPRDKAIIGLLADTGMRLSELAQIAPHKIDWDTQTILILGKGRKERIVKFGSLTRGYLLEHLRTHSPNGNIWGLTPDGIQILLIRLGRRLGIPSNPHAFRRFFAIELRKRGVDSQTIQYLGGWESLDMVERYSRSAKREVALAEYVPLTEG